MDLDVVYGRQLGTMQLVVRVRLRVVTYQKQWMMRCMYS